MRIAKKITLIAVCVAGMAVFGSCSSITHTAYTQEVDTSVVNVTVADLDVKKEKVSSTYSWNWNPFHKTQNYKDAALNMALNQSGSDIIVEPVYEIKRRGFMRGGSVTVSGYPAKLVNFHPMTGNEAEIIEILNGEKAVTVNKVKTSLPFLKKK